MRRIKVCKPLLAQHGFRTDPDDLFASLKMSPGTGLARPAHCIARIGEGRAIQLLMTAR
jgi:hypothetical protein